MPQTNWIKNKGKHKQNHISFFRQNIIIPTYYLGTDRRTKTSKTRHISFTKPLYYLITFPLYFLYAFSNQYITSEAFISKEKHKQLVKSLVIIYSPYLYHLFSILKSFFIYRTILTYLGIENYMPTQHCIT